MRKDRICGAGEQLAPLNVDEGGAGRIQPTLFAVKAAGVQRGHRDASEEHFQIELRLEAA